MNKGKNNKRKFYDINQRKSILMLLQYAGGLLDKIY